VIVIKQPIRRAIAVAVVIVVGVVPLTCLCLRAVYVHSDLYVRHHERGLSEWLGMPVKMDAVRHERDASLPCVFENVRIFERKGAMQPLVSCDLVRAASRSDMDHLEVVGLKLAVDNPDALRALHRLAEAVRDSGGPPRSLVLTGSGTITVGGEELQIASLEVTIPIYNLLRDMTRSVARPVKYPSSLPFFPQASPVLEPVLEVELQIAGGPAPIRVAVGAVSRKGGIALMVDSGDKTLPMRAVRQMMPIDEWLGAACEASGRVVVRQEGGGWTWGFKGRLSDVDLGAFFGRVLAEDTPTVAGAAQVEVAGMRVGPGGLERLDAEVTGSDASVEAGWLATLPEKYRFLLMQPLKTGGPVEVHEFAARVEVTDRQLTIAGRRRGSDEVVAHMRGSDGILKPLLGAPAGLITLGPAAGRGAEGLAWPTWVPFKPAMPSTGPIWELMKLHGLSSYVTPERLVQWRIELRKKQWEEEQERQRREEEARRQATQPSPATAPATEPDAAPDAP